MCSDYIFYCCLEFIFFTTYPQLIPVRIYYLPTHILTVFLYYCLPTIYSVMQPVVVVVVVIIVIVVTAGAAAAACRYRNSILQIIVD